MESSEQERPDAVAEAPEDDAQKLKDRIKHLEFKLAQLQEEAREAREEARAARVDPLTQTYNRRGLERAVKEGRERSEKAAAILIVDIDNFKVVNDVYGHHAGDEVLRKVSDYLHEHSRAHDIVARWGGEEFVVAFTGADAQDIINKFYRKEPGSETEGRAKIEIEVSGIEKEPLTITMSGGVTTLKPGESLEDAVSRADAALYRAKETGKDHIELADEAPK